MTDTEMAKEVDRVIDMPDVRDRARWLADHPDWRRYLQARERVTVKVRT